MRFKPVPEPPAALATVETVHRALPETAGDVDDCCRHLVAETPLQTRDDAATWLTFLRALELAAEEAGGFRRRDPDPSGDADGPSALDRDRLQRAFRERVDGAARVLSALEDADGPVRVTAIVEALSDDRSDGNGRSRRPRFDPERIERLLEWAVLLGLADGRGGGYRTAPARG